MDRHCRQIDDDVNVSVVLQRRHSLGHSALRTQTCVFGPGGGSSLFSLETISVRFATPTEDTLPQCNVRSPVEYLFIYLEFETMDVRNKFAGF